LKFLKLFSDTEKISEVTQFIKFSCEPISKETPTHQFNKNIISLKLKNMLENNSDCLRLNENQKAICHKCQAFLSFFSKIIQNQWRCTICNELNPLNVAQITKTDVEYTKNMNQSKPVLKKEPKIIVLCIDVSGSMQGNRINMVKAACVNTIDKLKKECPKYKVALITFESNSFYYGDGRSNKEYTIQAGNDENYISRSSNDQQRVKLLASSLLPIEDSHRFLVDKINSLNGSGGTNIRSALAHSVFLASSSPKFEIFLTLYNKNRIFFQL